jgi:hypothetical protein
MGMTFADEVLLSDIVPVEMVTDLVALTIPQIEIIDNSISDTFIDT